MKTVFGLFETYQAADSALLELEDLGYQHSDISVIGQAEVLEHKTPSKTAEDAGRGAGIGSLIGLIAGVGSIAIPGVGPLIGTGSIISGLVGGAGLGAITGGLVGFLRSLFGGSRDMAQTYHDAIAAGHILLAVQAAETGVDDVQRVMRQHGAHDLHVQEVARQRARVGSR